MAEMVYTRCYGCGKLDDCTDVGTYGLMCPDCERTHRHRDQGSEVIDEQAEVTRETWEYLSRKAGNTVTTFILAAPGSESDEKPEDDSVGTGGVIDAQNAYRVGE